MSRDLFTDLTDLREGHGTKFLTVVTFGRYSNSKIILTKNNVQKPQPNVINSESTRWKKGTRTCIIHLHVFATQHTFWYERLYSYLCNEKRNRSYYSDVTRALKHLKSPGKGWGDGGWVWGWGWGVRPGSEISHQPKCGRDNLWGQCVSILWRHHPYQYRGEEGPLPGATQLKFGNGWVISSHTL